jgi:glutamyl-tRNA(Gln) amidotransferase subunit D
MKPTVCVLTTGGTIGHRTQAGVAVMDFDPERLGAVLDLPDLDITFKPIFRKGSMDIVPADWQAIAAAVAQAAAGGPRGVVILHGTDTMGYTAAALAFMLRDLGIPVVLTGSMIPGGDDGSDGIANLRDAIVVAALADLAEVCVVFSADAPRSRGVIIRGCRARKLHSCAIDAFGSINAPPLATVERNHIIWSGLERKSRTSSALRLASGLDPNVVLVKLTPATTPEVLSRFLHGTSGAVLEGTGVGHIRTDLHPVIADFGRPTAISTQAVQGGERLGSYEVDRQILELPNIIPAADMSSDTALVKLMWALKQGGDVKSIMRSNIAGEISLDP